MTTLTRFAPPARRTVIRAGMLASDSGRGVLSSEFFLLALAEGQPLRSPVDLGVSGAMVRAEIEARAPARRDRELLATLGIDLDEVRRRVFAATSMRLDDPSLWRLRRSRVRPLRVTLSGPAAEIVLDEGGRKVIEVAQWASRRGRRTLIDREDLLWGLLADASSESVRILRRRNVDLGRLWTDLQRWHRSATSEDASISFDLLSRCAQATSREAVMSESGDTAPAPAAAAERDPRVPLRTVLREWGRIGCIGFGGPPAHIRLLRQLCVERRGWLDAREFEDAIAVCNLMPGPASTQLAIYCAWRLRGRLGALIGGAAFIVPGLIVILILAVLFVAGSPPLWVLGAGAGAGAAVPAVAVNAGWSLLVPSWRNRAATVRWLIYLVAGFAAAAVIGAWLVVVLLGCGAIELAARSAARPGTGADAAKLRGIAAAPVVLAVGGGVLASVAWVAFKVGGLSFGGGFVIIPLMQGDAVNHYHWMTGAQFLNAVALGQITPGPVVQTVAVVGYAAAGVAGGILASVVAFTPSFLLVLFGGPRFEQIRGNQRARAFLDGSGPAAIGAILGSAVILTRELTHPWQYAVLAGALVLLLPLRRGVVLTLLSAAATGVAIALAAGTVSP